MKINPDRPLEELTGLNRHATEARLGSIHCMAAVREQLRHAREGLRFREIPVRLRRGWAKLCLDTIANNRRTYIGVMNREWIHDQDHLLKL